MASLELASFESFLSQVQGRRIMEIGLVVKIKTIGKPTPSRVFYVKATALDRKKFLELNYRQQTGQACVHFEEETKAEAGKADQALQDLKKKALEKLPHLEIIDGEFSRAGGGD
jgi:hypothetical protein